MSPLDRRIARLETPPHREPTMEDWLDVLDADNRDEALMAFEAAFPGVRSPGYRSALDRLA